MDKIIEFFNVMLSKSDKLLDSTFLSVNLSLLNPILEWYFTKLSLGNARDFRYNVLHEEVNIYDTITKSLENRGTR